MQAATPEQIGIFKLAAARRYKKRGVPPQVAEQALNQYLAKTAEAMDDAGDFNVPSKEAKPKFDFSKLKKGKKKAAPAKKSAPAKKCASVEKIANDIAAALGRQRKS